VTKFNHSGHDYAHLLERWEKLASQTSLKIETLSITPNGEPVLVLETARSSKEPIYLSAGVHGDECAPIWGLLHWAEQNAAKLKDFPLILFPCLNPEGILKNTRDDQDGNDLNRSFTDRSIDTVAGWQNKIRNRRFSRCLHLHEDYDSGGIYLYELSDTPSLGRKLLQSCSQHIPIDLRPNIEGYPFDQGILHHQRADVEQLVAETEFGGAEPCQLFLHHTDLSITFESPSELDLSLRIQTHYQAIDTFVKD
jgi:protein MpaA